ncbi:hypothetical protein INS49_002646 [Diaporthe citri]|uniref:uncharacterized protein n=1 Tax=Diaporthe citri TaxID=83186 RepID=UPI001C81D557|nr:uncharacterized protein INS49_002646 [Diaporthe citri]KAG6368439.1 hypothetical protein INS49_002646 [Diaporthe citri]
MFPRAPAFTEKDAPDLTGKVYIVTDIGRVLPLDLENLYYHRPKLSIERYGLAKVGVWAYGVEFSKRSSGVLGVPLNPGLRTDLFSQQGFLFRLQSYALPPGQRPESEGGVDLTRKFWDWSEKQVERFL